MQGITLSGKYLSSHDFVTGRAAEWMRTNHTPQAVADFLRHWFTTDEAVVAQTSGSTGPPKTIVLQRSQMIASAQLTALHFGFKPGMRALLPLSADFIAGKMMLVRAIVSGLDLYVSSPTQKVGELFPGTEFDFTPLVPAQLYALLKGETATSRLGTILLGGSDVSPELRQMLPSMGQQEVWQGFGMTETVSHIALRRVQPGGEEAYLTLPGLLTEADANGQLRVWGAVTNYLWLHTKDEVVFDEPGRFRWLGRSDHVIVSAGHKIHPEKLEQRFLELISRSHRFNHLLGTEFYITAAPDGQYGQVPVLVFEKKEYADSEWLEAFLSEVKQHFKNWEFPRKIVPVNSFARTANGKIIRTLNPA